MNARARDYAGHTIGGNALAGTFSVEFTIYGPDGTPSAPLTGVVDTRRVHTVVPRDILETLGVQREYYERFRREDGFVRNLGVGLARMELMGKAHSEYIVFGDDPHEIVIGSLTLAGFGLAADPAEQRLTPGLLIL